jgi:hypothetical protein
MGFGFLDWMVKLNAAFKLHFSKNVTDVLYAEMDSSA